MRYIRISPMQLINMETVTRIETYESHQVFYLTIFFVDGSSYRCTEDETSVLLPIVDKVTEKV